jgi:acetolactate synthase-1/2/3 large subunit
MKSNVVDGGEAILQACRDLGIDYIFTSPGSDWGPVWEALARQKLNDVPGPGYLSCGHETLAVDLAFGYTFMTGRMQAVLLHAGVGLMQGAMGIHGCRLSEIPVVIMSGESSTFGDQEGFDPGAQWYTNHNSMGGLQRTVDPLVKWAHQAGSTANIYEMVMRAGEMAQATPAGPTYLDIPIEVMLGRWVPPAKLRKAPPPPKLRPVAADLEKAADMLAGARNPVIATASAGRTREGYEALVELAELAGIAVVEGPSAESSNFPKDHPLHQGFEANPLLREADLVLVVKNRTPWFPANIGPVNARVVVIDDSPFKLHMAYQNLQADLFLCGDVATTLELLAEALRAARPDAARVAERKLRWAAAHDRLEQRYRAAEKQARAGSGIHPVTLCAALGEALPQNTVYLDETTVHGALNRRHVACRGAQSYVAMRSGLGQGLGIALGVKKACPDRPVVTLIGDGAFLYNPSVQCFAFARDEKLPTLTVVYNNRGYRAMRRNQLSYYPDGAGAKSKLFYGEPINGFNYEELPVLFGGVGIRVEDPARLKPAIEQGHAAVMDGKSAVINVILAD